MINRIRKLLFGSISTQLLFIFIVCIIVTISYYNKIMTLNPGVENVHKVLAAANEIYVDVNRYELHLNNNGKRYLNRLSSYYNMNIAITDLSGKVLLADSQVMSEHIDLEDIKKRLQGSYNGGTFYQLYDLIIDNNVYELIIWHNSKVSFIVKNGLEDEFYLFLMLSSAIVFILTLYMLLSRKIKYIKYLTSSITQISYGNLDERVKIKGCDELSILAEKINEMTGRLKSTIEQERAADSFKKELIANVSHDLRTPLTSIIGYLELLRNKELTETKKHEYVEILNARADRLKYLIDDLFEFSKISSGGEPLKLSFIDVIELLEQCLGEYAPAAAQKGIIFNKHFCQQQFIIEADAFKLARVFENIISNAVKYSISNSIVNITIVEEESDIILSFKNISSIALDSNVKHIFDRFYRMDKSRNSHIEGSGLGLAIAKSIVELHQGKIYAAAKGNELEICIIINKNLPLLEAN